MLHVTKLIPITLILATAACVSLPEGPSVMVLPGEGVSFEQFREDDIICRHFATEQVGGATANQSALNSGVTSAIVGTALGAAAGAALGGGSGAAIGAGGGLVAGSVVGAGAANDSMYGAQQPYDTAYIQCMYTKGHQVPVEGQFSDGYNSRKVAPSSTRRLPPPPAGSPPPPPEQ